MDYEPMNDAQDQQDAYREFGGPSPYCEHGTFVGGSSGPDYMCGYCESGIDAVGRESGDPEWGQPKSEAMLQQEEHEQVLKDIQADLVAAMMVVSKANVLNQHDHLLTSMAHSYGNLCRMLEGQNVARWARREDLMREDQRAREFGLEAEA